MTNGWPPMPKHLMAKIYANHRRRHPASKGPYKLERTALDSMRVVDEEEGVATEWQIKAHRDGTRLAFKSDFPAVAVMQSRGEGCGR